VINSPDRSPCVDAETIAALADGKLPRSEIRGVLAHIDTCAACLHTLQVTNEYARRGSVSSFRGWRIVVAAAAMVAAVMFLAIVRPWSSPDSHPTPATLAALAPRSARIVEPRLTGGFAYAPYSGPRRAGSPEADAERLKLGGHAGIAIEQAFRDSSPEVQHTAGLAYLLVDDARQAIERLRAVAAKTPDVPDVWNDLAAAQYTAATRLPAPSLLPEALASVDRALRINPKHAEALFNRALVLERLGLTQQARTAWERYLGVDGSSPWAVEARSRLRMLPTTRGDAQFRRELPQLESAAVSGDVVFVAAAVQQWREQCRAWGEAEFLGRWGEAFQRGDATEASRLLTIARALGNALRTQSGEGLLADAVAAIDHADAQTRAVLADAHVTYRRGRIAYSRGQPSAAEPELRRAAALFENARSPMERMARYYAANTRYDQNDLMTAQSELEALLAGPQPAGSIASAALIRWELSLCRNAGGDTEGALQLLSSAATALRQLDERNHLAFVESLLADTLIVAGRPDEAWAARIRSFEVLSTDGRGTRLVANLASAVAAERRAGHRQAAMSLLLVEREASRELQDDVMLASTLTRAAALSAELGDLTAATQFIGEVRATSARVTDPAIRLLLGAHVAYAEAATTVASDPAAAVRDLSSAAHVYERMGMYALVIDCHLLRARAESALGDAIAAARTVDEGLGLFERFHVSLADRVVDAGVLDSGSELLAEAIRLSLGRGETALAFGYADRARMRFTDTPAPPAQDLAASVQSQLAGSGAMLVEIVVLPGETIIFSLDEKRVSVVRRAIDRDAVTTMAQRLAAGDRDAAVALYDLLLRSDVMAHPARTLIVVADPPLDAVPFAALYDIRAKRYLVEQLAVVFAESGTSLRGATKQKSFARILATALPSGESTGSAALAETNAEVGDVVAAYGRDTIVSAVSPTFAALAAGGRAADMIHISGHTAEIGSGGTAALVFAGADGEPRDRVAWAEIAAQSFPRLQLVLLAACDTLRLPPRAAGARAPSLGGAFLAAGARVAIGTLRPVGDRDARTLFRVLHRHLGAGVPAVQALRNTQLEAIADGISPNVWSAVAALSREVPGNL
jgi:CHAT domain-containing protein